MTSNLKVVRSHDVLLGEVWDFISEHETLGEKPVYETVRGWCKSPYRDNQVLVVFRGRLPVGQLILGKEGKHLVIRDLTVSTNRAAEGAVRALLLGVNRFAANWPVVWRVQDTHLDVHLLLRDCGWQAIKVIQQREGPDLYLFSRDACPDQVPEPEEVEA